MIDADNKHAHERTTALGKKKYKIPSADAIRERLAQVNVEAQLLRRMLRMAKARDRKAREAS